jgi:peptidoglycan hydrolase-like protein with peptidoglycan-binding domain
MRVQRWLIVGPVIVVAAGAVLVVNGSRRHSNADATGTNPTLTTARIERTDLVAGEQLNGTLGYPPGPHVVNALDGVYTWLPDEGAVVEPGHSLFAVDGAPVFLFAGNTPAWRAFTPGMSNGPDVTALQRALGLRADGHFGSATSAAVRRWQRFAGLPATGAIELGRVVFLPSGVRVGQHRAEVGDRAAPGQPPYETTGRTRVVTMQLDASRQAGMRSGLPVRVELPSGAQLPGRVFAVGRVARLPADVTNGGARPFLTVTVALDDPAAAGALDEQPVAVDVATATRHGVLAVPVTALLALREGGFGVEVIDGDARHRIVAVTPGLFSQTLVEITGAGVHSGMTVATAQ